MSKNKAKVFFNDSFRYTKFFLNNSFSTFNDFIYVPSRIKFLTICCDFLSKYIKIAEMSNWHNTSVNSPITSAEFTLSFNTKPIISEQV